MEIFHFIITPSKGRSLIINFGIMKEDLVLFEIPSRTNLKAE